MINKIASTATGLTAILLWTGPSLSPTHAGGVPRTNMSNMSGVVTSSPQGIRPTAPAANGDRLGFETAKPSVSGPQPTAQGSTTTARPSVSGPQPIAPASSSTTISASTPATPTVSGPQPIAPANSSTITATPTVSGPQPIAPSSTGGVATVANPPAAGTAAVTPTNTPTNTVAAMSGGMNPDRVLENSQTNGENNAASNATNVNENQLTGFAYTNKAIELSRQLQDRLTAAQAKSDAAAAKLVAAEQSNDPTEIEAAKAAATEAQTALAAVQTEARQLLTAAKNGDPAVIQRMKTPTTQIDQPVW